MATMLQIRRDVPDTENVTTSGGTVREFDSELLDALRDQWGQKFADPKKAGAFIAPRMALDFVYDSSEHPDLDVFKESEKNYVKDAALSLGFSTASYGPGLGWRRTIVDGKPYDSDGKPVYTLYVRPKTKREKKAKAE